MKPRKRAEVWRLGAGKWAAGIGVMKGTEDRTRRIAKRHYPVDHLARDGYPTHAEALSAALSAVGLAPEKEK